MKEEKGQAEPQLYGTYYLFVKKTPTGLLLVYAARVSWPVGSFLMNRYNSVPHPACGAQ
jgi:hypothetical protein